MAATNTRTNFGWVTKCFHWLIALLIITTIPIAVLAEQLSHMTPSALSFVAKLYSFHKTLGVVIFFVAILRILWAITQPKPLPLAGQKPWEMRLAAVAHWCLYGSLVIVPLTGWIHHAATVGFAPIWWPFGQNLPLVPKSDAWANTFSFLHVYLEKILLVALIAHIAGALKHHFIDKDATLRRMIGTPQVQVTDHPKSWTAPIIAVGIFGIVTAFAGLNAFTSNQIRKATPEMVLWNNTPSEWAVTDGTLQIIVDQFGNQITGEFTQWTAAINFDPAVTLGHAGDVEVEIAIPSLKLGSVSAEAMGPDYFDVDQFNTATYSAKLTALPDRFMAEGALTLKGVTKPLTFNFQLVMDGDTAKMSGQTTVQRLDFGVGATQTDEANLGFGVTIVMNLGAQKAN